MLQLLKRQSPGRIIALGFAFVILLGSVLLSLPCSIQDGVTVRYIDALYTSTSAVCVTGLIAVDAGDTFTPLGQFFLGSLIQIGGLGVTAVGVGVILAMGKKINLKGRNIIREAMNLDSGKGTVRFIKSVFLTTLAFELSGAVLSFLVFVQDYPPLRAAGISLFHSVAAFNNSGFDILGNFQNLIPYQDNVLLNLVTCGLIFFGGIGFLVIREIISKRFRWKKFSMHKKVVLSDSPQADRACYLARSLFSQRFGKNRRIFHVSARHIFKCRSACSDGADVYRRVSRIYRRRYQDQYVFCAAARD